VDRTKVSSPRSESGGDYLQENLPVHSGEALKSDSLPPSSRHRKSQIIDAQMPMNRFEQFACVTIDIALAQTKERNMLWFVVDKGVTRSAYCRSRLKR
jgi:hypothetical protein